MLTASRLFHSLFATLVHGDTGDGVPSFPRYNYYYAIRVLDYTQTLTVVAVNIESLIEAQMKFPTNIRIVWYTQSFAFSLPNLISISLSISPESSVMMIHHQKPNDKDQIPAYIGCIVFAVVLDDVNNKISQSNILLHRSFSRSSEGSPYRTANDFCN